MMGSLMLLLTRMAVPVAAALLTVGCTAGQKSNPPGSEFTRSSAESTLEKMLTGVANNGVKDFCSRDVRSVGTCTLLLDDALKSCLIPGDKPKVLRAAYIPEKEPSEGGWLLEVGGKTMGGQEYISEFFVVREDGEPRAASGIYWTGLGLDESPFGPNNTKVPQNACPGR
jgi:hypothetical protein